MTSSGNPLQESLDNQEKIIEDKSGSTLQEINETEGRALQKAEESGGLEPGETFNKPTKTKTEEAQNGGLPKDNTDTDDEKNENEDGSSAEENLDTEYTVLINGEKIALTTDKFGASLVDKLEGHGLHIQKNGDIVVLSGSGGKGKGCGGRLLINTKGGQLTKSGPITEEVTASSSSSTEDGPGTNGDAGGSQVAYSGYFSGDHEVEIQGTKYIKAREIVLDATDTLTLKANKVLVQTDEWVEEKGLEKRKVDNVEEEVTSQRTSEIKEDTSKQYDARASQNIVGSGHINQRVKGDYALTVDGIADIEIMCADVKAPLITRMGRVGFKLGVNSNKGKNYGAILSASSFFNIGAGSGNIELSTARGIHLDTQLMETDQGIGGRDTNAAGIGEIKIDAKDGFTVNAWKGDATIETDKTAGGKVMIKGKEGVEVEATTGDMKLEAKTGNIDMTAVKIYLN